MAGGKAASIRKRLKAGAAFVGTLVSAAVSHQAHSAEKLPFCQMSFNLGGVNATAKLTRAGSNKPVQTDVTLKPALASQAFASEDFRSMSYVPNLEWQFAYMPDAGVTLIESQFTMAGQARAKLPRPTGCTTFAGPDRVDGPAQMMGIDNPARRRAMCSSKFLTTQLETVKAAQDVKLVVHDGFEKTLLTFTFDTSFQSAVPRAVEDVSAKLKAQANAKRCRPSAVALGAPTGCFLTTATCESVGLNDDCWELAQLRRFRDTWLKDQPGGQRDIALYYEAAPQICAQLDQESDSNKKLLALYWTRILPCALAIRLGFNETARRWYTDMMADFGVKRAMGKTL